MFKKIYNKKEMKSSTETDFEESPESILSKITEQLESAKSTGRKLTKEIKKWCLILGISVSPLLTRAQELATVTKKDFKPLTEFTDTELKEKETINFSFEGGDERMLEYHSIGFYNIKAGENITDVGKHQRGDYENIEPSDIENLDNKNTVEFIFSNHIPRGSQGYNINYELNLKDYHNYKEDGLSTYSYEIIPKIQEIDSKTPYQLDTSIKLSNLKNNSYYLIRVPIEGQNIYLRFRVKK